MRIFLALLVLIFLVGCDKTPVDNKGRYVLKPGEYSREVGRLTYIMFDGHEYVRMSSGHQGGICHSPKCKCLEERR